MCLCKDMSSLPQQLTPTTNPRQSSAYIRKAISTKKRFEIFKRDNFICQYCGRTPDDGVILHVDHIIPVAKGGENEDINLTTSCFDCNSGKRDGLISVSPEALSIADVNKGLEEELKSRKELES